MTHANFDQVQRPYGSIKEKKVHPDLLEERAKLDFDQDEMTRILLSDTYHLHKAYSKAVADRPELQSTFEFYEMSREQQMEVLMKRMNIMLQDPQIKKYLQTFSISTNFLEYSQGQVRLDLILLIHLFFKLQNSLN